MPNTLACIQSVQDDYDARTSEIERYFDFVELLDVGQQEISKTLAARKLDEGALLKTLKANCFLLLYNLMEAVTKNAVQGLYDHLRAQNADYDNCCDRLKKMVLKNVKREIAALNVQHPNEPTKPAYDKRNDAILEVMTGAFIVKNLLSGSVDAKSLRELAQDFGFSPVHGARNRDPKKLLPVKSRRNALAHGDLTFDDVGKDYTVPELKDIKESVFNFMQQFILNVDDYLRNRLYLAVP